MIDHRALPERSTPRGAFGALIRCACGHGIGAHTHAARTGARACDRARLETSGRSAERAMKRVSRLVVDGGVAMLLTLVVFGTRERAMATPVFAQTYGRSCSACHETQRILNAFGR